MFESGGGGGWGDPYQRDPELVLEDVRNELISREQAAEAYAVVVTDKLELNHERTGQLRSRPG